MPTTTPLTARQADSLNDLASTCASLHKAATDLARRTALIAERVGNGQHIDGFAHDVLGQEGREVQHYASKREAQIAACRDCPKEAFMAALTNTGVVGGVWFTRGAVFVIKEED